MNYNLHAWSFAQILCTAEVPESCVGFLFTMNITSQKAAAPEKLFDDIPGPFSTFVGSETLRHQAGQSRGQPSRKRAIRPHIQEDEAMNLDWYAEPGDGIDKTSKAVFWNLGRESSCHEVTCRLSSSTWLQGRSERGGLWHTELRILEPLRSPPCAACQPSHPQSRSAPSLWVSSREIRDSG